VPLRKGAAIASAVVVVVVVREGRGRLDDRDRTPVTATTGTSSPWWRLRPRELWRLVTTSSTGADGRLVDRPRSDGGEATVASRLCRLAVGRLGGGKITASSCGTSHCGRSRWRPFCLEDRGVMGGFVVVVAQPTGSTGPLSDAAGLPSLLTRGRWISTLNTTLFTLCSKQ
jgi:hypothetical protein